MFFWKPDATRTGLRAETPFCSLDVFRTRTVRKTSQDLFTAQIWGAHRERLDGRTDLESEEAAKRWAEQRYAEILRAELAALEQ